MLPHAGIVAFWQSVEKALVERHKLDNDRARAAIHDFVVALEGHDAEEMIYHEDPDEVADIVAGGYVAGFRDPKGSSPAA
ncbi:MAG TPA: hypothetical protein VHD36_07800 [Pirellulales bacterium]|nr:hypothetical protein [Pirellulales bacterium]